MKNLIITLCFLLGAFFSYGQSFDGKSDQKINIGYEAYGFGNGVKATYDYGLGKLFSLGAGASVYFNDGENDYYIFARSQVHLGIAFDLPCEFDIYPGLELGYLSSEKIGVSGYLGFRYFFTKKVGVFAEIGNNGSVGVSFNV
ncbi:DUF6646 family protein [Lutimonas vermicola]|uniref:DUF6646 family protein n=1 Tax=Lutimonas vermicola TaxID=414288 RepID=A0ABU9L2T6_9FLAO